MSCLDASPPPLPTIAGGISIPALSLPSYSGQAGVCCQFNYAAFINLPSTPPIPFLGAALAALDADIVTFDAYLAAYDTISMTCPLD